MNMPSIAQLNEIWKNLSNDEKNPFYIEYEEKKFQYEKAIKNKTEQVSYSKNKAKRTLNEMMNNSINSSSNDDSFIKINYLNQL